MAELAELCSPRVLKFWIASGSNFAGMTTPGSLLARSQPESCHHPTREDAWEQAIRSSRLKMKLAHMIWHWRWDQFNRKLQSKTPSKTPPVAATSHLFLTFHVATNLLQVCHGASSPVPMKFNFLGFALKRVHCQIVFIECENLIASLIRDQSREAQQNRHARLLGVFKIILKQAIPWEFHSTKSVQTLQLLYQMQARDQHQPCLCEERMAFCFESHVVSHHSEVCGMHHLQNAKTTPRVPKMDEMLFTLIGPPNYISYSGHVQSFTTPLLGLCFKRKYRIFYH